MTDISVSSFDPKKHRLGRLCKRDHGFAKTGKSVRFQSNGSCVECARKGSAKYHENNRGSVLERKKEYRENNREMLQQKDRDREKEYGVSERGRVVRLRARRTRKLSGRGKISSAKYRRTEKGKETQRRCNAQWRLRKGAQVGVVTAEYKEAMLLALQNRCPVCRVPFYRGPARQADQLTWDHVVSLKRGGRDDDGNLLPLCRSCNGAKAERSFQEWLGRPVVCIADLVC